jgi:hypothetical protein
MDCNVCGFLRNNSNVEVEVMKIQSTYIDYYIGSYGDTIRIAFKNKNWAISFRENITKILKNEIDKFDICKLADTECSNTIDELKLIKVLKSTIPCIVTNSKINPMHFNWKQDEEELETLLGLIDGLIDSDDPGHQYLTDEEDNILIILAYMDTVD